MNLYGISNGGSHRIPSHIEVQGFEARNNLARNNLSASAADGIHFGGYHDACFIIAAETIEQARTLARETFIEDMRADDAKYDWSHAEADYENALAEGRDFYGWLSLLQPIPISEPGIVYYSEGDC